VFDYFASGCYAHVEYDDSKRRYSLKMAKDMAKDQSYFLSSLSQKQPERSSFPLGKYIKGEVRKMALALGTGIDDKPERQNFIAKGYCTIVGAVAVPGLILDRQENIFRQHRGISFYTIGQRKGLGVSYKEPLSVTAIDRERNAIMMAAKEEVYRDGLIASELNWIGKKS
jgi:tRNA-specific 2-thiouridylase